jgi:outer membrane protein assembly factor BamB
MDDLVDYEYDQLDGQLIWNFPAGLLSDNGSSFLSPPVRGLREAISPDPAS